MKNRIIFLAGGNSVRFGSNKLLYEYNGKPLYRHTLDILVDIIENNTEYSLVVITQYKPIYDYVKSFEEKRITSVLELDCQKGASYSIKAGIMALPKEDAYDTFVVADQPGLSKDTLIQFMTGVIASGKKTGCVRYEGESMNPVMFHSSLERELLQLLGDQGGKKVLRKYLQDCWFYDVTDKKEIMDIDKKTEI